MTPAEIARHLAVISLFAGLDEPEILSLATSARELSAPSGSILFMEHDPGDVAYLVVSGTVDLVLESAEGQQVLLHRVSGGGHFGELALLDDQPRSATAIVTEPATLLTVSRGDLLALFSSNPTTMLHVIHSLTQMVRRADHRIKTISFFGVTSRLAAVLLELDQPPGHRRPVRITQEQVAGMTGSVRQTVSAILAEWARSGVIRTGRGNVTVLDRAALQEVASA